MAGKHDVDGPPRNVAHERVREEVTSQAERTRRARERPPRGAWFGLGMFGLIGWSVAIPTLAAIALGLWLDGHSPAHFSWTLTLLFIGVVVGCLNAWYWIRQEIDRE